MKVLVTGASGFVGRHVCAALATHEVIAPTLAEWTLDASLLPLLRTHSPTHVIHLAGPAHVPSAERDASTRDLIVGAAERLASALRDAPSVERVLYVSSAEVYAPSDRLIDEDATQAPSSEYGRCKAEASAILLATGRVIVVRPFNQIGPGQSPLFAIGSFAKQLNEGATVLRVGNIDLERDFSDVRDSAVAHVLALQRGRLGETYNIASGRGTTLRTLINAMIGERAVTIETDPTRVRKNEPPRIIGDATKLRRETGYQERSTAERAAVEALISRP